MTAPLATHCPSGHPYRPENTYIHGDGYRVCRECHLERNRRYYAAKPRICAGAGGAGTKKTKPCYRCGIRKVLGAFGLHAKRPDGHTGLCITCKKNEDRARYMASRLDPEWVARQRERDRAFYARNRDKRKYKSQEAVERARKKLDKKKSAAHIKVRQAILYGRIQRPERCSRCNKRCTPHGHHADYTKPLSVEWLCTSCHGFVHRKPLTGAAPSHQKRTDP